MTPEQRQAFDRAAERAANSMHSRGRRTYARTTCPYCGRTISEGAYSGRNGNFAKHAAACEKSRAK